MKFSQRLKQVRKNLHLKQDDLAQACNVQLTAISKYENDLIKPGFEMLSKIGLSYNINLNWLINELGEMFINEQECKLIKNGTTDTPVYDNPTEIVNVSDTHSIDLSTDLKVEYYDTNHENYTKIYRKNGEVECYKYNNKPEIINEIVSKLNIRYRDENQIDFILSAINALDDEKALNDMKVLIKGIELSKSLQKTKVNE